MIFLRRAVCLAFGIAVLSGFGTAFAANLTPEEFRRELLGVPMCGTPTAGPLAGKSLCTVHHADGTALVAGAGLLVRGLWQADAGRICRRNAHEPIEQQHCVDYERLSPERYKNSDGVEFCIGPCPDAAKP